MSNTLNTPIEAFELEYPMRVERYELVPGSGGEGRHRGATPRSAPSGCSSRPRSRCSPTAAGTARWAPTEGSRAVRARTAWGGGAAAQGHARLSPGDVVCVRTPAGGGYG